MTAENLQHRMAASRGVKTLYKFRPYRTADQREWVREILVDHKIYFARASQINDPFDLSPRFEEPTREELIVCAEAYFLRNPDETARREQTMQDLTCCDLAEHIDSFTKNIRARIEDQYPVFSLAGNRNHPMLWSHYADGHSGLCIHFHSDERSIFAVALGVMYDVKRPSIPIEAFTNAKRDIFERVLLTKGDFWEYEDEYRWISFPDTDWSDVPISFDGQHAHFHPGAIAGITVGIRMPDSHIAEILELAALHAPKLSVWRTVEKDTFEFSFERIG